MTEWLLLVLILALLGSQAFWMRNVQRLVDKFMSGTYYNYVQAEKVRVNIPAPKETPIERIEDDYAAKQAEEANRRFGLL